MLPNSDRTDSRIVRAATAWPVTPARRPRRFDVPAGRRFRPGCEIALAMMCLFIGLVGAYDTYLSIKLQNHLGDTELNPLGRWLMELDGGSVAMFMGCKFAGTIIVLGVVVLLYRFRIAHGLLVASSLTAVQAGVMLYLLLV